MKSKIMGVILAAGKGKTKECGRYAQHRGTFHTIPSIV